MDHSFHIEKSPISNIHLLSGFISAIQIFSKELTGTTMKTINFDKLVFHFYKDSNESGLIYVLVTDEAYETKEVSCKIHRIASLFYDGFSKEIENFTGNISVFNNFAEILNENEIGEKKCGARIKCKECPSYFSKSQFITEFIESKKISIELINTLLKGLLNEIPDLLSALVIDINGYIITQQSVSEFDETVIESVISVVEPTLEKIKRFAEASIGSGTFDTNEFRLFYLEMKGSIPALFVLVADAYSNIDNIIPYSYIVAEKISLILNNRSTSLLLPKLQDGGGLELIPEQDNSFAKDVIAQIFLIGAEKAGKSSLVEMYISGNFIEEYKPTIGLSIIEKELQITKRVKIRLYLFDMGGLKNFAKVRKFYYNISRVNAILILFDYTRMETLENVNEWLDEAKYFIKNNSIPYILIGNKIDLIDNREELREKAEQIANQYNCQLFETSAFTGEGIDELFTFIVSKFQI